MCVGNESRFFNGHTNLTDSRFLTFGVKGLLDTNRKLRDAMLFNIMSYMNHRLLTDGNTVASIDEAYLFLSNLTTIEYIRNAMKRVRKKNSAVLLASQNIDDFLAPDVREYTKPIFAIPANRFLFYPGHVEQRDFCDALSISSAEYALIDRPERRLPLPLRQCKIPPSSASPGVSGKAVRRCGREVRKDTRKADYPSVSVYRLSPEHKDFNEDLQAWRTEQATIESEVTVGCPVL